MPSSRSFRPRLELMEARDVPAAMLQVIHNSPYASAATVDVYVNGDILLDDFKFRTATPFVSVPSGVDLNVQVAPGNSQSAGDAVFSATVNLAADTNYVAVAVGDPLSAGADKFGLSISDNGRLAAAAPNTVDLLVFHGSPDAPTVDVQARGVGTLVNDFSFRDFANGGDYLTAPPADLDLDVTLADGKVRVRGFDANLTGLAGGAAVVLASGFVAPPAGSANDFQLLVALPDGQTLLLPVLAATVDGTARGDTIRLVEANGVVTATVNGRSTQYLALTNPEITVNGLGGGDVIDGRLLQTVALLANGGAGNDLIFGGRAGDELSGGEGGDVIYGQGGDDVIAGGAGNDLLFGGAGDDELSGEAGFDVLDGGAGADRVSGGGGINVLFLDADDEFVLGTGIDLIIRRR